MGGVREDEAAGGVREGDGGRGVQRDHMGRGGGPSFQGIGLGKAVMERVVGELLGKGIRNIALYSEPRVLGFYRPLGFVADPDGIRGMVEAWVMTKTRETKLALDQTSTNCTLPGPKSIAIAVESSGPMWCRDGHGQGFAIGELHIELGK
ncbi:hypothetical protein C3L33_17002, partial [Rhododendron williamsianum]